MHQRRESVVGIGGTADMNTIALDGFWLALAPRQHARSRRPRQASKYSCVQLGRRLGGQVADQNNITRIVTWEIEMARGTVKWFNPTKGYGFIQPQGGGKDVFVHISAVERAGLSTLNEGQQLEYEIEENRGKTSAVNLKVK
jgi:cold shock protein